MAGDFFMSMKGLYQPYRCTHYERKRKYYPFLKWVVLLLLFIFALPLYLLLTKGVPLPAPIVFSENLEIPVLMHTENKVVNMP